MRTIVLLPLVLCAACGCTAMRPCPMVYENPIQVQAPGCDYLWDRLVDSVDDYFEIEREERPKWVGPVVTAGRIDCFPQGSATLLEPWRHDVVGHDERLESTLQSMRRRCIVQVIPVEGAWQIDVAVYKELEDMPRPDMAPTAAASFRVDDSLSRLYGDPLPSDSVATQGWIPQGRDPAVEQRIIAGLLSRLQPSSVVPGFSARIATPEQLPEPLPPVGEPVVPRVEGR
ncbi:MAG TPA: hypothetical protein VHZ24_01020 [Pirellulales bacterium]|nr:hypothetical protein [Pirellulales bacterium]